MRSKYNGKKVDIWWHLTYMLMDSVVVYCEKVSWMMKRCNVDFLLPYYVSTHCSFQVIKHTKKTPLLACSAEQKSWKNFTHLSSQTRRALSHHNVNLFVCFNLSQSTANQHENSFIEHVFPLKVLVEPEKFIETINPSFIFVQKQDSWMF